MHGVGWDHHPASGNLVTNQLGRKRFALGHEFHFRSDLARAGRFQLSHFVSLLSFSIARGENLASLTRAASVAHQALEYPSGGDVGVNRGQQQLAAGAIQVKTGKAHFCLLAARHWRSALTKERG